MRKLVRLLHILGAICTFAASIFLLLGLIMIAMQGTFLATETNCLVLACELVLGFIGLAYTTILIWKNVLSVIV